MTNERGHAKIRTWTIYSNNGEVDKAVEHLQMALTLKPEDADAYNNPRVVYAKEGLIDKALEKFMAADRSNSTDLDLCKNLSNAYKAKISFVWDGRSR